MLTVRKWPTSTTQGEIYQVNATFICKQDSANNDVACAHTVTVEYAIMFHAHSWCYAPKSCITTGIIRKQNAGGVRSVIRTIATGVIVRLFLLGGFTGIEFRILSSNAWKFK